jgi:hypothetical protein
LQKYEIYNEKNYIAPMKNKVRRTILLLLIAVILFSASIAVPALNASKWKDLMQGAALGLMIAGIISIASALVDYIKSNKTDK